MIIADFRQNYHLWIQRIAQIRYKNVNTGVWSILTGKGIKFHNKLADNERLLKKMGLLLSAHFYLDSEEGINERLLAIWK